MTHFMKITLVFTQTCGDHYFLKAKKSQINSAQIKKNFFNIPQIKAWLLCGYKIDIDGQRDPFPSYWYQNFQPNVRWQWHFNPFCEFWCSFSFHIFIPTTRNSESHLAEQLLVKPMICGPLICCTLSIPFELVFLIDVLFHRSILRINIKVTRNLNSFLAVQCTLILLQYTPNHQLTK